LISFTVLRRSSSAFPSGEPICVSERNEKRKGFPCAKEAAEKVTYNKRSGDLFIKASKAFTAGLPA